MRAHEYLGESAVVSPFGQIPTPSASWMSSFFAACLPRAVGSGGSFGLNNGGPGGLAWTFLTGYAGFLITVACMAEMASMLVVPLPLISCIRPLITNYSLLQGPHYRRAISLGL